MHHINHKTSTHNNRKQVLYKYIMKKGICSWKNTYLIFSYLLLTSLRAVVPQLGERERVPLVEEHEMVPLQEEHDDMEEEHGDEEEEHDDVEEEHDNDEMVHELVP